LLELACPSGGDERARIGRERASDFGKEAIVCRALAAAGDSAS
jgi:hypothetical protein